MLSAWSCEVRRPVLGPDQLVPERIEWRLIACGFVDGALWGPRKSL
jgi:hypothetical protein